MHYKRVTKEERRLIGIWKREEISICQIAKRLRRSAGSISRELRRNHGKRGYRFQQAHWRAQERARRSGARRFTPEVKENAEQRLRAGWTPAIISGRAKLEGHPSVSKETIYTHIYKDAKAGGDLWKMLPRAGRKRRRRCPRQEGKGRGMIPNQRMIDKRPVEVDTRQSVGHWEGDLVNGGSQSGHLVTLVERNTRYALVGKTPTKEAEPVTRELVRLLARLPNIACTGLTLDNGKEFAMHEKLETMIRAPVYFARPYHSWERGSNENLNGLIRRLHPKGSSFANIDALELNRIESFLNDRPRKCLGWKTSREAMSAFLASAL